MEAVVKVVAKAGLGTVEVMEEVMVAVAKPEVKVGVARVAAMEEEARWRQWRWRRRGGGWWRRRRRR